MLYWIVFLFFIYIMWDKLPKWAVAGFCIIVGTVSIYAFIIALSGKPVKMYGFEFNQEIKYDTIAKIRYTDTCISKIGVIAALNYSRDSLNGIIATFDEKVALFNLRLGQVLSKDEMAQVNWNTNNPNPTLVK